MTMGIPRLYSGLLALALSGCATAPITTATTRYESYDALAGQACQAAGEMDFSARAPNRDLYASLLQGMCNDLHDKAATQVNASPVPTEQLRDFKNRAISMSRSLSTLQQTLNMLRTTRETAEIRILQLGMPAQMQAVHNAYVTLSQLNSNYNK